MCELRGALSKLKNGKAGGSSDILPDMVKATCEESFRDLLLDLVHTVWEERQVPKEWADATLIPIPKKGDLGVCDIWRGRYCPAGSGREGGGKSYPSQVAEAS